jgi:hypothetical protein
VTTPPNAWLMLAAALSAIAALLHVAIVFGGAAWYRFFGAGKRFVRAAERGEVWQHGVTLGIAAVLASWSAVALSAAGAIGRLPLLGAALVAITAIYLLRGLVLLPMLVVARAKVTPFVVWSSLICLGYGIVHAVGVWQVWPWLWVGYQ